VTSPADDTVQLRAATAADAGSVVALCKASLTETYGAFMEPDKMRPWTDETEVEDYVARMWPRMTVAIRNDRVVGVVALDDPVIDLIWVKDGLRGQGIGSSLMDHAEQTLGADHDDAELECFAPNLASLTFYRSRGYAEVRRYYEAASGIDKVVLRKTLVG
jgi:ribosomal protein S18 acetylase RimI-like enzyme